MRKLIYSQLRHVANRDGEAGEDSAERENMAAIGLLVWKEKCLEVRYEGVERGFTSDGKKKGSLHVEGPKTEKKTFRSEQYHKLCPVLYVS